MILTRSIVGYTIILSWEMPSKTFFFFAYSALIMCTLKGSISRFFSFSAPSQSFKGDLTGLNLP